MNALTPTVALLSLPFVPISAEAVVSTMLKHLNEELLRKRAIWDLGQIGFALMSGKFLKIKNCKSDQRGIT